MKKSKAASSSRAQAGTFGSAAFGGADRFSQSSSTFGNSFGATPSSQLSYVYEPPELSTISDPIVIVAWKSLQKKASATKTKALDELLAHVAKVEEEKQTLDDGFLEAWTRLYARTSIDNARQVRQRAHTLQGRISAVLGKRIAKSLPVLIGPWLCGLHDNDKLVVRSTQESFSAVFTTDDKRLGVWKVYHSSILEYCSNTILYEDAKTLSDERSTNKDDAESKFSRTMGSAILTVARALEVIDRESLQKHFDQYKSLLDSNKLWGLSGDSDSFLRQAVYRLIRIRLHKFDDSMDDEALRKASQTLLSKALRKDQSASILSFVALLTALTKSHPTIWTTHFTSQKKTAPELLQGFLKSLPLIQSSDFWTSVHELLDHVPTEVVIPVSSKANPTADSTALLDALHHGLAMKENFKPASSLAWDVFLSLAHRYQSLDKNAASNDRITQEYLCPIVRQYVLSDPEGIAWSIADSPDAQAQTSQRALSLLLESSADTLVDLIRSISAAVVELMQASLPEQSQGFATSQERVGEAFARWCQIKQHLLKSPDSGPMRDAVLTISAKELQAAMQLLASRNGKPFGAALAIRTTLKKLPASIMDNTGVKAELEDFLTQKGPGFVGTPATPYILDIFRLVDNLDPSLQLYNKTLTRILEQAPSPSRTSMVKFFVESTWPSDPSLSSRLEKQLHDDLDDFTKGDLSRATQLEAALGNKSAPNSVTESILAGLVKNLTLDETADASLRTLSATTNHNQGAVQHFLSTSSGASLTPKLLVLSQSSRDPELQKLAADLSARTKMLSSNGTSDDATIRGVVESIEEGLKNPSNASMTVPNLVGLAEQVLQDTGSASQAFHQLLLNNHAWDVDFTPFIDEVPDPSLSVLNSLGAAISWVDENTDSTQSNGVARQYDSMGYSIPLRSLLYTLTIAKYPQFQESISDDDLRSLLIRLATFNEVLTDHISLKPSLPLWKSTTTKTELDVVELLAQSQGFVCSELARKPDLEAQVLDALLRASEGTKVAAYYAARAYMTIGIEALETNPSVLQYSEDELLQVVRKPSGSFEEVAKFATAYQGSGRSKVANNLIAELARFSFESQPVNGIRLVTLLNCVMRSPVFDDSAFNQQHRLVLFVKHAIASIRLEPDTQSLDSELFKTLLPTVALIKDIFDNFWTELIDKLISCFQMQRTSSTLLEPSLRLLRALQVLAKDEETNDDLKESWDEKKADIAQALTHLLRRQAELDAAHNQPRQIVNALVARSIDSLASANVESVSLYPVIASGAFELQRSAFKILHKLVPAGQEKTNFDAALTKDFTAKLPEELFSLVLEAPSEVSDLAGAASLPSHLVQYIFAWKLIYDHWERASYQVQHDYFDAIKESNHLHDLLDLIFEVAINSRQKPLNASRLDFTDFAPDVEEGPERDCQVMICHLYYLSLKHVPSLVRSWWRDECPRSIQRSVEEWTERYFSPFVVAAELAEVSAWSTKQETDTPLEVKISTRAREVTAMYPLDEQMCALRVTLPSNYPLSAMVVESINRVGVEEKKWRAWLMNAQGVMNFAPSSGGIGAVTDGLVGFRRNVTGMLDGHSECAICYSIVNADRQLPTKKCQTCKKLFHGSCLFRWFRSSGHSSCPLCRTTFNYGQRENDGGVSTPA